MTDAEDRGQAISASSRWLPQELQEAENSLATNEWLSEESVRARGRAPEPKATSEPEVSSVWLPPEIAADDEESHATEAPTISPDESTATPAGPAPAENSNDGPSPWLPAEAWQTKADDDARQPPPPTAFESDRAATAHVAAASIARPEPGRGAVEAYCGELFPAGRVAAAAERILQPLTGGIQDDQMLLEITRKAAAELLMFGELTRSATSQQEARDCDVIPLAIALRANGTFNQSDQERLERHLASCLVCRAAEVRAVRADRAFAGTLGTAIATAKY